MAAIFQTTYSNTFSWMKLYEFLLEFHWSLFLRVQSTIFQHWFRQWLGAGQATSHYLNQWRLVYWRVYASWLTHICVTRPKLFYSIWYEKSRMFSTSRLFRYIPDLMTSLSLITRVACPATRTQIQIHARNYTPLKVSVISKYLKIALNNAHPWFLFAGFSGMFILKKYTF